MTIKSKNIITGAFMFLLSISILFGLNSCSCGCGTADASDVPLSVLNKANNFIITRTGKEFFDKYITPDFSLITYKDPYYKMAYKFFMPEKPYVNTVITFSIDKDGKIDGKDEIAGIPEYLKDPASCRFNIDDKQAIKIAKENGLKEGVSKWKVGLLWDSSYNQYIWHVLSTYSESGKDKNYKGSGKEFLIDPNTGQVISANLWHIP